MLAAAVFQVQDVLMRSLDAPPVGRLHPLAMRVMGEMRVPSSAARRLAMQLPSLLTCPLLLCLTALPTVTIDAYRHHLLQGHPSPVVQRDMLGSSEQEVRDQEQPDALGVQPHSVSCPKHHLDSIRHVISRLLGSVWESLSTITGGQKIGRHDTAPVHAACDAFQRDS